MQIVLGKAGDGIWFSDPALCTSLPKYCPMLFQWRSQTSCFQVLLSLLLLLLLVGKAARASQNFFLAKGAGIVIPFYLASWRWPGICHKTSHSVEIADFLRQCSKGGFSEPPAKCWHVSGKHWWTLTDKWAASWRGAGWKMGCCPQLSAPGSGPPKTTRTCVFMAPGRSSFHHIQKRTLKTTSDIS